MHQIPKLNCFASRLAMVLVQSIEARYYIENENGDGAVPTGDPPITSEWQQFYCLLRCALFETKIITIWEIHRTSGIDYKGIIYSWSFFKYDITIFKN